MCYTMQGHTSHTSHTRNRPRIVIKMENFPERRERIKSSVITVVVGEEASQWILELVPDENQDSALSASLWRIDHLSTDLEVTLTLTASCPSLTLQGPAVTASSPVTRLTGSEQARLGIHLVSFLTEALEKSPHNDTLRVECQLTARNPRERPHCDCTRKNSLPQLEPVTHWSHCLTVWMIWMRWRRVRPAPGWRRNTWCSDLWRRFITKKPGNLQRPTDPRKGCGLESLGPWVCWGTG